MHVVCAANMVAKTVALRSSSCKWPRSRDGVREDCLGQKAEAMLRTLYKRPSTALGTRVVAGHHRYVIHPQTEEAEIPEGWTAYRHQKSTPLKVNKTNNQSSKKHLRVFQ